MRSKLVVSTTLTEPCISVQSSSSHLTAYPSYLQASILRQHISPLLLSGRPVSAKLSQTMRTTPMVCNARGSCQTLPVAQGQTAMYTNTGMQVLSTLPLLRPHLVLAWQAQTGRVIRTTCWDAVHRCKADRTLLYRHVRLQTRINSSKAAWHGATPRCQLVVCCIIFLRICGSE